MLDYCSMFCDEWSEWVSCPVCDLSTVCGYCVEYLKDGTWKDCSELHQQFLSDPPDTIET